MKSSKKIITSAMASILALSTTVVFAENAAAPNATASSTVPSATTSSTTAPSTAPSATTSSATAPSTTNTTATTTSAAGPDMEKCYGIVKAGKNDCPTSTHSCAGSALKDRQTDAFILLPKGVCDKIVGGSLTSSTERTSADSK